MMSMAKVPQGDELVTVELTRKELIALTGVRFNEDRQIKINAYKKLNNIIEQSMSFDQSDNTTY